MARPLDCARQLALKLRTDSGDAARQNLALLVDESFEEFDILEVDVLNLRRVSDTTRIRLGLTAWRSRCISG